MSSVVLVLLWLNLHHHRNMDVSIHPYCVRSLIHIFIHKVLLRTVEWVHWHPPSSSHFDVLLWNDIQVVLEPIFVPTLYSQYIPQLPALLYSCTSDISALPIGNVDFDWYPINQLRVLLQKSEICSPCFFTNAIHRILAVILLRFSPNKNRIHQFVQIQETGGGSWGRSTGQAYGLLG